MDWYVFARENWMRHISHNCFCQRGGVNRGFTLEFDKRSERPHDSLLKLAILIPTSLNGKPTEKNTLWENLGWRRIVKSAVQRLPFEETGILSQNILFLKFTAISFSKHSVHYEETDILSSKVMEHFPGFLEFI
ncbi:hypothetical protein AVEN_58577-1 [Araneus ventricosus]|uniref:Uncharacterized protein n=1 Tax=Araneus ventricosus TaxID=182803 RepID=A0A4Y2GWL7_ARAVE|nr:hypothetical protein AVEN_58577-1 [Araneus ventricosus]